MESAEIEQEVTDLLLVASTFSALPTAGMSYCRLATECITHNLYYQEFGEYPKPDAKGNYPSLPAITNRVKDILERQTGEVLFSINAQSRGSLHWNFEFRSKGVKKYHVESVVNQISNAFSDIYGEGFTLTDKKICDPDLQEAVKKTFSQELTQQGSDGDSKPLYNILSRWANERINALDFDIILSVAESASEKGIEFEVRELLALGFAADSLGRLEEAEKYNREALRLSENIDDPETEARCLLQLATTNLKRGEYDPAKSRLEKAHTIFCEIGDTDGQASVLGQLPILAGNEGNYNKAERLHREEVAFEEQNRPGGIGYASALLNFGEFLRIHRRETDEAERQYKDSLDIFRKHGDMIGESYALGNLGIIAGEDGDYDKAERLLRESLEIKREVGDRQGEASSLGNLGWIAQERGKLIEALTRFNQSLEINRETGIRLAEAECLHDIGFLAMKLHLYEEAEHHFRLAVRIWNDVGHPLDEWYVKYGYTDPDEEWLFPPWL